VLDVSIHDRLTLFGLGDVYRVNTVIVNKKWLRGLRKEAGKAQYLYGVFHVTFERSHYPVKTSGFHPE